jgi:hypothetical protein
MLERYRTLRAAADLSEFTVADVAQVSGVNPKTVATVLRRDKRFFKKTGTVPTGAAGGQFARYVVRPETSGRLQETLAIVEEPTMPATPDVEVPPALLAAEELLLEPSADSDRELNSRLARIGLNTARALASGEMPLQAIQIHIEVVEFLLALASAEEASEPEATELVKAVEARWARLSRGLKDADPALYERVGARRKGSAVAARLGVANDVEVVAVQAQTPLVLRLLDVLRDLALSFRVVPTPTPGVAVALEIVITTGLAEDFVRSTMIVARRPRRPEMIVIDEAEDHSLAPETWRNEAIYLGSRSAAHPEAIAGAIRLALNASGSAAVAPSVSGRLVAAE